MHDRHYTKATEKLDSKVIFTELLSMQNPADYTDLARAEAAAVSYASATMLPSLGEMAIMARDGGHVSGLNGWSAIHHPNNEDPNRIDLVVVNEKRAGGYLLSLKFAQILTPEAEVRTKEILTRVHAEAQERGINRYDVLTADAFEKELDLPSWKEMRANDARADNFVIPVSGHRADLAVGSSLDLGETTFDGRSPGGKVQDVEDFEDASKALHPVVFKEIWREGLALIMNRPQIDDRTKAFEAPRVKRGTMPCQIMEALSDMIRGAGLEPSVRDANLQAGSLSWQSNADEIYAAIEEAGRAVVFEAGGMMDASVTARFASLWAQMFAKQVQRQLKSLLETAQMMLEDGVNEDDPFHSDDSNQITWAERSSWNDVVIRMRTENGDYRLKMSSDRKTLWKDAEVRAVEQILVENLDHGGHGSLRGRFLQDFGRVRADHDPSMGRMIIPYTVRNLRDMNEVLMGLSNVCFYYGAERKLSSAPDGP